MFQKREAECVISATDAKNNFGALIAKVAETGEPIVVERQGKGRAAIISLDDFREFRRLQDVERRRKAREQLEALRQEIMERNKDLPPLTEEEIEGYAQELRDDAMQAVVERYAAARGGSIYS